MVMSSIERRARVEVTVEADIKRSHSATEKMIGIIKKIDGQGWHYCSRGGSKVPFILSRLATTTDSKRVKK